MSDHSYTTVELVKEYLEKSGVTKVPDSAFQSAIDAATAKIDDFCGRTFLSAGNEPRVFQAFMFDVGSGPSFTMIDDVPPAEDVVTKVEVAATPEPDARWEELHSGWWLGPLRRLPGYPYTELHVRVPRVIHERYVRVTSDWGWDEVPEPIMRACRMLAARYYLRAQSPMGQENVNAEFGTVFVRNVDPDIKNMLSSYKREYLSAW